MSSARRSTRVSRGVIPSPPKKNRRGHSYNAKRSSRNSSNQKEVRKWVQVMRKPSINAKYKIPKWVPIDTLTPQERDEYKTTMEQQQETETERKEINTNDLILDSKESIIQQFERKRDTETTTVKIRTATSIDPATPTTNENSSDDKFNNGSKKEKFPP